MMLAQLAKARQQQHTSASAPTSGISSTPTPAHQQHSTVDSAVQPTLPTHGLGVQCASSGQPEKGSTGGAYTCPCCTAAVEAAAAAQAETVVLSEKLARVEAKLDLLINGLKHLVPGFR
jgi:hypothetical protein